MLAQIVGRENSFRPAPSALAAYASSHPWEDFAESFIAYFGAGGGSPASIPRKMAYLDGFFAGIAVG